MKNIKIMLIIILIVFLGVIIVYREFNTNPRYKLKEGNLPAPAGGGGTAGTAATGTAATGTAATGTAATGTAAGGGTGTPAPAPAATDLSPGEIAQNAAKKITTSIDTILTEAGIPIPTESNAEIASVFNQLKNLIVSEAEFNNKDDEATLMNDKNMPTVNTVVPSITDMSFFKGVNFSGSFCELYDTTNKTELNNKCLTLTAESCNSVDCCILVDGNKCVAGNKEGPYMVSGENTDYNYYLHKYQCYGNCYDIQ